MKEKLIILGSGESGVGAAILGQQQGYDVLVSDRGQIKEEYKKVLFKYDLKFEEGKHSEDEIMEADLVVKSPGIPDTIPLVIALRERNIPVISEIEFAGRYTDAKTICITGSNGKTTTTMLTYHILKKAGMNVGLAGNVGRSFARQVAEEDFDIYVIELSSFQLDGMFEFKADIAMLLNITPDHLDRYDDEFQNYIDSKFRVIQNMTENDTVIWWLDDPVLQKEMEKRTITAKVYGFTAEKILEEGAYRQGNELHININDNQINMSVHDLALKGKHNQNNSMAAGIATRVLEIRKEIIRESLSDFQNVEHRLEFVAKVHGIEFINDSKATNVNSTWYALESMGKDVVWIVGGVDKGNDYEMLEQLVADKVKAIVCLGKDNSKIIKAFEDIIEPIIEAKSASEAVAMSYQLAKKGDSVLLSPACASFDLFDNYEERGQLFKKAVRAL
jgi:UDP-N-acetylmuramoylalanine--D-glutamate ligase